MFRLIERRSNTMKPRVKVSTKFIGNKRKRVLNHFKDNKAAYIVSIIGMFSVITAAIKKRDRQVEGFLEYCYDEVEDFKSLASGAFDETGERGLRND